VVCPVRDLGSFPVPGCEPVRRFSWSRRQRHRPGLQFMVSTGLHHGFESLEEARLLLALDLFTGRPIHSGSCGLADLVAGAQAVAGGLARSWT